MSLFKGGKSKDLTTEQRINKDYEKMHRKEEEKKLKKKRKMDAEELKDREKEKKLWAKMEEYEDKNSKSWQRAENARNIGAARREWFEKIVSNNETYGHAPKDVEFELDRLQYFDWMFHDIYRPGPVGGITRKVREAPSQGKGKGKGKEEIADMYFDLVPSAIRNALWNDPLLTNLKHRFQTGTKLTFADKYDKVYDPKAEISYAQWVEGIDTVEDGEAKHC